MIHTIQLSSIPMFDDINFILNNFEVIKDNYDNLIYLWQYKDLKFNYYKEFNILLTKVNLNRLINKNTITDLDYEEVNKTIKSQFYEIFKFTEIEQLNRIDYKQDIITEHKDTYIKLIKKGSNNYRSLRQYNKYKSSVYYNSKSTNINIYDKQQELLDTDINNLVDIKQYENMIRFEVQLKRNKLYYIEHSEGICRELQNYFTENDRDYYLNTNLKNIIYNGDYYNIYHSRKILQEQYTNNMTEKLVELQKQISVYGISDAKQEYNQATFRNYINKIQDAGVNPILIPKNEGITHLPALFNFTDENIYLADNYELKHVA